MRRLLPVALLACGDPVAKDAPADDEPADSEVTADSEPVAWESDPPPHTDPPADTDPPDDTQEPGPSQVVRFVALGDAGEGNDAQYRVATSIAAVCALRGCEFALYLGDNFYDNGVDGVDDPQFLTKFEQPYAALDFPFYAALGNHDFGEVPLQFWKTDYQVDYTQRSTKWTMPDHFYAFDQAHATFLALDTNMIMLGLDWTQDQKGWIRKQIQGAKQDGQTWILAYGHHPWRSNGEHGNAGNYEGVGAIPFLETVDGTYVRQFFKGELCADVDLYLCGHDHNRQWLDPVPGCRTELVVSGAGAKTTDFVHRDRNPTVWEEDGEPGFLWVELADDVATLAFYDQDGNLDHEGTLTK